MATANVVIRCSDPQSVIAKLPAEFQDVAKIHYFDKEYAKRRYHEDADFREKERARCRDHKRERYANDPAYRAKLAEQRKIQYARKKCETT